MLLPIEGRYTNGLKSKTNFLFSIAFVVFEWVTLECEFRSNVSFSIRLGASLVFIFLILALISLGQGLLISLTLAFLFAILLRPLVSFMQVRLRFHLILSVSLSVPFGLMPVSELVYLISL